MRILLAHEFYQTAAPSGEDAMFRLERDLLRRAGHDVVSHEVHNDSIGSGITGRLAAAGAAVWSAASYRDVRRLVRHHRPDVVHFHNTFPLISPSAYRAAASEQVAVVQTLHNYRLVCPGGLLLRNGAPCEDCVGHAPLAAVRHACYRDSRAASAVASTMLIANRLLGTYQRDVDRYIVLTEFARRILERGGLPAERLIVRPNGLAEDPGMGAGDGGFAFYASRLSAEKGVESLVEAWGLDPPLPLVVAGDGPLRSSLERRAAILGAPVTFIGRQEPANVIALMRKASVLMMPSECYEGLPVTFLEGIACGTPVAASRIGALAELVTDGVNGVHFRPRDPSDQMAAVRRLLEDPVAVQAIRRRNRELFDSTYSPARSLRSLEGVYLDAIHARSARSRSGARSADASRLPIPPDQRDE